MPQHYVSRVLYFTYDKEAHGVHGLCRSSAQIPTIQHTETSGAHIPPLLLSIATGIYKSSPLATQKRRPCPDLVLRKSGRGSVANEYHADVQTMINVTCKMTARYKAWIADTRDKRKREKERPCCAMLGENALKGKKMFNIIDHTRD